MHDGSRLWAILAEAPPSAESRIDVLTDWAADADPAAVEAVKRETRALLGALAHPPADKRIRATLGAASQSSVGEDLLLFARCAVVLMGPEAYRCYREGAAGHDHLDLSTADLLWAFADGASHRVVDLGTYPAIASWIGFHLTTSGLGWRRLYDSVTNEHLRRRMRDPRLRDWARQHKVAHVSVWPTYAAPDAASETMSLRRDRANWIWVTASRDRRRLSLSRLVTSTRREVDAVLTEVRSRIERGEV